MAEPTEAAPALRPPLSWPRTWLLAVTRPVPATYAGIAADPRASVLHAVIWVCLGLLAGMLIGGPLSLLLNPPIVQADAAQQLLFRNVSTMLSLAPLAAAFYTLFLLILSLCIHILAARMGGQGQYNRLVYSLAAFVAPLGLASGILSAIPEAGAVISILLTLYGLALSVIAVKAVHRLNGWLAGLAVCLPPVLVLALINCPLFNTLGLRLLQALFSTGPVRMAP